MKKEFVPKTEFVKRLLTLREKAISEGMPLLSIDEILEETDREIDKIKHPRCTCWRCMGLKEDPYPE